MTPAHIKVAFEFQSRACADLGSPFMETLMGLFATRAWPRSRVTNRIFAWQGDIGPRDQSVPLRLAGALHALHLQGHPVLADVYPPKLSEDDGLWDAICTIFSSDAAHIEYWLDSPPQTNEVRRSATLIAVGHWLADRFNLPIRTSELGASGGLNLHWDDYAMTIQGHRRGAASPALVLSPDWRGVLPPAKKPIVTARAGVDISPLDPSDPSDVLRLQSYLWPDQPERLSLTRAAISAARTRVDRADAVDWLTGKLFNTSGQLHLIYSTVAWQYLPKDKQAKGDHLIRQAGALADEDKPLAWFGMENDGVPNGAALTLRLWPGDLTISLGRADFHGRWVDWNPVIV